MPAIKPAPVHGGAGPGGYHAQPPGNYPAYNRTPDTDSSTEAYDRIYENPFLAVTENPRSTFSIDVDTASYANVRRFLREGSLPPADAVRIEELVNYFAYSYPNPKPGEPVSISTDLTSCPWKAKHTLLRVGLKTRPLDVANAPPCNLVFLVDVSGSMSSYDKLPLVKQGLRFLVDKLRPQDRVAMVVYAGSSGLVLPSTSGDHKGDILEAIERLESGGSTNGGAGIRLAYDTARQNLQAKGVNRVILATDGDFNVGTTSQGDLIRLIEKERDSGVFLTVLGFGTGNLKDSTMEKLADKGNGAYAYIDSLAEARKVLSEQAGSTLVTVAKDVKLQLEFNPRHVASYRLIGYENRMLAAEDFNNDHKDAGEMGAGHTVTALYELVPPGADVPHGDVDPLKYQKARDVADSNELLMIKIRWKAPDAAKSQLMTHPVASQPGDIRAASQDARFAAAVAGFGMMLRGSQFAGTCSYDMVADLAGGSTDGDRGEFLQLVSRAKKLKGAKPVSRR